MKIMNKIKLLSKIKEKHVKFLILLTVLFFQSTLIFAQTAVPQDEGMNMETYNTILLIILLVLINLVFIPLLISDKEKDTEESEVKETTFQLLKQKFYGLKPMEEEKSLLIDEDYDGIQELDNNVPPWFNVLFLATIIFAIVYLLDYHVFKTGKLPLQEYNDEVYAAELQREELIRTGAFINENNVAFINEPDVLSEGKQIYTLNCVPCHGVNGEGIVGPNLTDDYWIHGGGVKNIYKTVKYGVPVKGMISWQTQLNPKKMQAVVSYVMTLHGTNPPGGKAPEGNLYKEQDSSAVKSDSLKTDSLKTDNLKTDSSVTDKVKSDSIKNNNNDSNGKKSDKTDTMTVKK